MVSSRAARELATSFPDTDERAHFESAAFRVREKIFAQLSGDGAQMVLKLPLLDQAELIATDPRTFSAPPHWGGFGWTNVRLAGVDLAALHRLLATSWRLVAPKRLVSAYDAAHPA